MPQPVEGEPTRDSEQERFGGAQRIGGMSPPYAQVRFLDHVVDVTDLRERTVQIRAEGRLMGLHFIGEPLRNAVACTYGYSINRKAASCLLKSTNRIAYPVDEFKKYLKPGQLRWGAVVPELISVHDVPSTIQPNTDKMMEKIWIFVLDIRNYFLSLLN